jgi:hypothetical protein
LDRINTRIGVSWILLLHFHPLLKCLPSNLVHMYGSIVLGPCEHGGLSNCNFNEKHDDSSSKFVAHTAPQVRTHQFWCVMVVMMMMNDEWWMMYGEWWMVNDEWWIIVDDDDDDDDFLRWFNNILGTDQKFKLRVECNLEQKNAHKCPVLVPRLPISTSRTNTTLIRGLDYWLLQLL